MDFRPISESVDLDLGHSGPISGVWAWIWAIKGLFLPFSGGLDLDLGHSGPILGILEQLGPITRGLGLDSGH